MAGRGAGGDGQEVPHSVCRLQPPTTPAEGWELGLQRGKWQPLPLTDVFWVGEYARCVLQGRGKANVRECSRELGCRPLGMGGSRGKDGLCSGLSVRT